MSHGSWSRLIVCLCIAGGISATDGQDWTGNWYSPPIEASISFNNATVRTTVRLSTGGDAIRLRFSNQYGRSALAIGAVRVTAESGSQPVTFKERSRITLAPGTTAVSDPVTLKMLPAGELVVSVFYPEAIPREITLQNGTAETSVLLPGNAVSNTAVSPKAKALDATYFLIGVDVKDKTSRGTIVVIADSMTGSGAGKWPALLAQRLAKKGKPYGVLNAAIGGNRILRDSKISYGGPSTLSRFDRDALDQPGVKYVIVYEGINDIGVANLDGLLPPQPASAEDLISGIRGLAERAHQRNVRLYAATLVPFEDFPAGYYTLEKNEIRQRVNEWIRTSSEIDGYFDFERALADPARPNRIRPELQTYAHPNDAGQRALSEAVDLSRFE